MRPQGTKMALGQTGLKGCATHTPPRATLTRALGEERDFVTHHSSSKGVPMVLLKHSGNGRYPAPSKVRESKHS